MKDISKELLRKNPSDIFKDMYSTYFKELDDPTTDDIEWLSWDPDSLIVYLFKKDITVDDPIAVDKLMSIFAFLYRMDIGTSDAKAFEKIVHAFNNDAVIVDVIQEPTLEAVCYTIREMHKLYDMLQAKVYSKDETKFKQGKLEFTGEIPGYVASVAYYNNFPLLIPLLSFATESFDFLNSTKWRDKKYDGLLTKLNELMLFLENTELDKVSIDNILNEASNSSDLIKSFLIKYIGLYLYNPCIIES